MMPDGVSTHSRLKAAGSFKAWLDGFDCVSTHSRLKAAGPFQLFSRFNHAVSTHSRLKAAGKTFIFCILFIFSFNTQPPKGGWGFRY